jgi:hypothetical protein
MRFFSALAFRIIRWVRARRLASHPRESSARLDRNLPAVYASSTSFTRDNEETYAARFLNGHHEEIIVALNAFVKDCLHPRTFLFTFYEMGRELIMRTNYVV